MPGPKAKCIKCEDVIQSMFTHDFVRCKCGNIFVDGGSDYCRYGGKGLKDIVWVKENPPEKP